MSTPDAARSWWIAMGLIPSLGRQTIERVLAHFGGLDAAARADLDSLMEVPGIGPVLAEAIRQIDIARVEDALDTWTRQGLRVLIPADEGYPAPLRDLPDGPAVLFCRGAWQPADTRAVAIVGTRTPTPSARAITRQVSAALARHGWCVVSGLARGVDTLAHQSALRAGGRTLAVLGGGVHTIYPPENRSLAEAIGGSGAVLSETQPQTRPSAPTLVARNRIISGLSRAVLVVEAGPRSGSLHAARFARRQGRPVFALDSAAAGNQQLIAEGAIAVAPSAATWATLLDSLAQKH